MGGVRKEFHLATLLGESLTPVSPGVQLLEQLRGTLANTFGGALPGLGGGTVDETAPHGSEGSRATTCFS